MTKEQIVLSYPEGEAHQFIMPECICVFCGKTTNDGIAFSNEVMRDYDGQQEDWGHLECYIHYVMDISKKKVNREQEEKPLEENRGDSVD